MGREGKEKGVLKTSQMFPSDATSQHQGGQGRMHAPSCGDSCSAKGVECLLACLFLRAQVLPKFQIQRRIHIHFEACVVHQKLYFELHLIKRPHLS